MVALDTNVDTNVLIYACDKADLKRQRVALDLVSSARDGVLLWQIACEFVAASRKLRSQGFTTVHAWDRLADYLTIFPLILPASGDSFTRSHFPRRGRMVVLGCDDCGRMPGVRRYAPLLRGLARQRRSRSA
jgi:hypothetical protein